MSTQTQPIDSSSDFVKDQQRASRRKIYDVAKQVEEVDRKVSDGFKTIMRRLDELTDQRS